MANFYRLIVTAFLVFSAVLPTTAQASFGATQTNPGACTSAPCWKYMAGNPWPAWGSPPGYKSSAIEACQAIFTYMAGKNPPWVYSYVSSSETVCSGKAVKDATTENRTSGISKVTDNPVPPAYSCPANATVVGSLCTCNPGTAQNATNDGCENNSNNCPKAGVDAGWWAGQGRTGPKSVCSTDSRVPSGDPGKPGCLVEGFSTFATGGNSPPGGDPDGWSWGAQMAYTGAKCTADPLASPSKPEPDDPKCVPPKVAGKVNGKDVCYTPSPGSPNSNKPSSSQTPPKTTTSSNPDGSTNNTTSSSNTQCSGGKCTTTTTHTTSTTSPGGTTGPPVTNSITTTCTIGPGCGPTAPVTQGSTTTTNTSTNPNGSTTSTSTTTPNGGTTGAGGSGSSGSGSSGTGGEGDSEGDPSQFAGQCGAAPFCDGDAVMCAIAAATFATNCVLKDPEQPTPLYDQAKIKTGDLTTGLATNSTVNVGSGSFDQTEFLGGAAGMSDLSVTVMGSAISIPFSTVNVWLARLGVILQAVTFILCARIVVRG